MILALILVVILALVLVVVLTLVLVVVLTLVLVVVVAFLLLVMLAFPFVLILCVRQTLGEGPKVHVVGQLQDCALCAAFKVLLHRRQPGSHDHEQICFRRLADVTRRKREGVRVRPGRNDALSRYAVATDLLHQVLDDSRRGHNRESAGLVPAAAVAVIAAGDRHERHPREQSGECKAKSLEVRQSHQCPLVERKQKCDTVSFPTAKWSVKAAPCQRAAAC